MIELLAPSGDLESLQAAIRNGADAVYLGAGAFNARRKAANFSGEALQAAIDEAHLHATRVYLTLNTLITDDECDQALDLAGQAYAAGIDAIILQDVGLAEILHKWLPDLALYASTQMTIADAAGLYNAARLGLSRVILARELSLADIGRLSQLAADLGLETEVFIHGALCISLSGQCLLSSLNGGRSGNRGECAQPCRLPYRLGADQQARANTKPMPWLSPRDQALYADLAAISQAGVSSLKIEGRMRGGAYVGQVVAIYRDLLDQLPEKADPDRLKQARRKLLLAFNRGGAFTDRYLTGRFQADFLTGFYTGSHGVLLGEIIGLNARQGEMRVLLHADWPADQLPIRGDVLSIRRPEQDQETASAPIGTIGCQGRILTIRGFHPDVLPGLAEGDPVYCMSDRQGEHLTAQADRGKTIIALTISAETPGSQTTPGSIPGMIRLAATVLSGPQTGLTTELSRPAELIAPLMPERLEQQLKKTGQTAFRVKEIRHHGQIALPIAIVNDLRRQLLQQLGGEIIAACRRILPQQPAEQGRPAATAAIDLPDKKDNLAFLPGVGEPGLSVYYYRLPVDPDELACGADLYYLPILGLSAGNAGRYRDAIAKAEPSAQVMAWLPPALIGRMGEILPPLIAALPEWGYQGFCGLQSGPDIWRSLPASPGQMPAWTMDTGANIYNRMSLHYWFDLGAAAICPSVELSDEQLRNLLSADGQVSPVIATNEKQQRHTIEIPVYGHLRVMTSAFCPVGMNLPECRRCHTRPPGPDQPDPGRIHWLEDRRQMVFPLLTHPRVCFSELLQHNLLCLPQRIQNLQETIPYNLLARLYFLHETAQERRRLIAACRMMLQHADVNGGAFQLEKRRLSADAFSREAVAVAARLNCRLQCDSGASVGDSRS